MTNASIRRSWRSGIRTVGRSLVTGSADESLSLRDIQAILGHAHLSTTAEVYLVEDEKAIVGRVAAHLARQRDRVDQPAVPAGPAIGYDAEDLSVLFPGGLR